MKSEEPAVNDTFDKIANRYSEFSTITVIKLLYGNSYTFYLVGLSRLPRKDLL